MTQVVDYDNFNDGSGYETRWFPVHDFYGVGERGASANKTLTGGVLTVPASPFTAEGSFDVVWDHMKYFAASTRAFDIPLQGGIQVSADIQATTVGTTRGRLVSATGRRLLEGQQGAATLDLVDADTTGLHLSWWVSGRKAFALYERVFPNGECALATGFTQIVGEWDITPGMHNFSIEYRRNVRSSAPDMVMWNIDGAYKAHVQNVGVPLDVQNPARRGRVTYASQGAGEVLQNRLSAFSIGHGIGSMVDEFPFNLCPNQLVPVPAADRVYGQGVTATFDNFRVTTVTPAS